MTDGTCITCLPSAQRLSSSPTNGLRLLVNNNTHEGEPFVPTLLAWLATEFPSV